jgi:hypothetical protein
MSQLYQNSQEQANPSLFTDAAAPESANAGAPPRFTFGVPIRYSFKLI